jgi:transposase
MGKREEDLSGLPVERIDYELPESERSCPQCGETMRDIGVDVRRELELIPPQVIVAEHATHAYACRTCGKDGGTPIIKATAPAPLLSGSLASASLVAHIAVQKYMNAMPLYRLEKGFAYDGVIISRQNMANWVIKCSEFFLNAIYLLLITYLLRESVLHADETVFQVLREPGRAAQTKSYEWVYETSGCAEHKIVIYEYKETRSQIHPQKFLKEFKGYLHTDGYQSYHNLPPDIIIVGCWAHVRRKWENLLKTISKEKRKDSNAARGVAYIDALFSLERQFQNLSPKERYEQRLEKSVPVADAFFAWAQSLGALPKFPLGEAVSYMVSQRKYLYNVFLDGRL